MFGSAGCVVRVCNLSRITPRPFIFNKLYANESNERDRKL